MKLEFALSILFISLLGSCLSDASNFNDKNSVDQEELVDDGDSFKVNAESIEDETRFAHQLINRLTDMSHHRHNKRTNQISHNGYSLDTSISSYRTMRHCHVNEVCKTKYKSYFECICPKSSLCVSKGSLFYATCSTYLQPYVWIQTYDDTAVKENSNE